MAVLVIASLAAMVCAAILLGYVLGGRLADLGRQDEQHPMGTEKPYG